MGKRLALLLMAAAGLAPQLGAGEKADKPHMQAKRTVRQFGKALWAKGHPNAVLKLVDVPWYDNLDHSRLIRDRSLLKQELQKLFPDAKAPAKVVFAIKDVHTYAEVLAAYGKEIEPDDRKLLDQVLTKNDLILNVEVKGPEGQVQTRTLFMVALRDGRPKIVGMREP